MSDKKVFVCSRALAHETSILYQLPKIMQYLDDTSIIK